MADNNSRWVFIDETHYIDTVTGITHEVDRDSLQLSEINKNGTIGEMVETINANFQNLAAHGGGPTGIAGIDGSRGEDGVNVEYIYALSDKMVADVHYPTDNNGKINLFDNVESRGSAPGGSAGITWYDHAQPITKNNKNEYVFSRYKRGNEGSENEWIYDTAPVLWAHWGETGRDGDGVEYIFAVTQEESNSGLTLPVYASLTDDQKVIFQIDDFVPSTEWFRKEKNKQKVQDKLGENFNEGLWTSGYGFDLTSGWKDNPIPVDAINPYQWVSIRRSTADEDTGDRFWEDFSEPVLWNSYGKSTRIFIIYCNMPVDEEHPENEKPNKPVDGTGIWINTDDSNTLDLTGIVDALTGVTPEQKSHNIGIWNDNNIDVDNTISWMCSGIFTDDGNNISWSQPFRITGAKGAPGEDGDNIEFVYCLSAGMPAHPIMPSSNMTDEQYDALCAFFDGVENAKNVEPDNVTVGEDENNIHYYIYNDAHWYDNPQGVDEMPGKKTEWVWQRSKAYDETRWTFMPEPVIWSHWGEDGTDGDGVEYIFHLSQHNPLEPELGENPPKMEDLTGTDTVSADIQRAFFTIDDFFPDDTWFTRNTDGLNGADNKAKAKDALVDTAGLMTAEEFETLWSSEITNETYFGLDYDWTDDPLDTSFDYPFEFVSIRKSRPNVIGKKEWQDFGEPKLWTKYLIQTRVFIVYCNVDEGVTPASPDLNYGWWDGDDRLVAAENSSAPYQCKVRDYNSENTPKDYITPNTYWVDNDVYEANKIAWMCSITFAENGIAISCSQPFRLTGDQGRPGADGSTIEFVYALCDVEEDLKYPKPEQTSYENLMVFFDNIENAKYKDSLDPSKFDTANMVVDENTGVAYYDYQGTYWCDNPQGISDEDGKRKEWVWSRNKNAGDSSSPWTVPPKPVIWSHWGEDGTDGDGIEYIFCLGSSETFPVTEQDWNVIWTGNNSIFKANDTAKAVYAIDDFVPSLYWFNNDNKDAVSAFMHDNELGTFVENDFTALGTSITNSLVGGSWTDNPSDVNIEYKYQFISIRKCKDGIWGPFSYPKIWGNYTAARFTSFAFTATETDVDLSNITPAGGDYTNPVPNDTEINDKTYQWTDGPEPDEANGKVVVWMTSAIVIEGQNISSWTKPQKMEDTAGFQIEWCSEENISSELKSNLEGNDFNFEIFLKKNRYNVDAAELEWRDAVKNGYTNSNEQEIEGLGLTFDDGSINAIYMATCQYKKGGWTNWTLTKVKGEKGDKGDTGTSIKVNGRISYEVYLDENTEYTWQNASSAFSTAQSTLSPAPVENNLLIVYPALTNSDNIYYGDSSMGGALYMWKYSGSQWFDYNNTDPQNNPNNEEEGSSYISTNKHLILWDGDSWQDIGELEGPEGKRWELVVKYANDDTSSGANPGDKVFVTNDADIPGAKWMGTLTYLDDGTDHSTMLNNPNYDSGSSTTVKGWTWSLFKGQDGYGYEYIYYVTQNNSAPNVPQYSSPNDYITPNVIPSDWRDEPVEPNVNNRFVWMCWRKFNTSTGRWSDFMGKDGKTAAQGGKARLWQLFADSISSVEEYYHADSYISPSFTGYEGSTVSSLPENWGTVWKSKSDVVGHEWDSSNRYLFNIEVISYTNGTKKILDPHYISVFADGISDIIDYYILDTDGSSAPRTDQDDNPITESSTGYTEEGKDYWTTNVSTTVIDEDYPYLWNASKKVYENGDIGWTTPIVIGVFSIGKNGDNAVYLDLDNEMDVVQIDSSQKVLEANTFTAVICMYEGTSNVNIKMVEVSGENGFGDKFTLTKSDNGSSWSSYTDGDTISGNGSKYIKMTLNLSAGSSVPSEYNKITFVVTSVNDDVRTATYTLVATINPSIYSIQLSSNVIVKKANGNMNPTSLVVSVVKNTGGNIETYSSNQTGEGGFTLYLDNSELSSYTIQTSSYSIGNTLTFELKVDTDDNNTTPDTVMDKEVVYVVGEGQGYDDGWFTSILSASTSISGGLIMTGDLLARNQSNHITAGVLGYNTTINADANNIRFFAGDTHCTSISTQSDADTFASRVNSAPFRVTEGGKLYATDAVVSGEITATSGTIGGITIASNMIKSSNDTFSVNSLGEITATSGTIGGITIASNMIKSSNDTFSVTNSGLLSATNAFISGSIIATELHIGNYDLTNSSDAKNWVSSLGVGGNNYDWITNALSSTSISGGLIQTGNLLATDNNGHITAGVMGYNTSSSTDVRFFAGTTNLSFDSTTDTSGTNFIDNIKRYATFRVDEDGTLYAKKAVIEGVDTIFAGYVQMPYMSIKSLTKISGQYIEYGHYAYLIDDYTEPNGCTLVIPNPSEALNGFTYHIISWPNWVTKSSDLQPSITVVSDGGGAVFSILAYADPTLASYYSSLSFYGGHIEITCVPFGNSYRWIVTLCTGGVDVGGGSYTTLCGYSPTHMYYAPIKIQTEGFDPNTASDRSRDTIYIQVQ